jgi:hypothetical protein
VNRKQLGPVTSNKPFDVRVIINQAEDYDLARSWIKARREGLNISGRNWRLVTDAQRMPCGYEG